MRKEARDFRLPSLPSFATCNECERVSVPVHIQFTPIDEEGARRNGRVILLSFSCITKTDFGVQDYMIYKTNMSEEAYKQAVANEIFPKLNYIPSYGTSKIDFAIADINNNEKHLFWAEAKNEKTDVYAMLAQLLLTVKKTYQSGEITPPSLIGCFDSETFAIFNFADFIGLYNRGVVDWNIPPSNHKNAEFQKFQKIVETTAQNPIRFNMKTPGGVIELKSYIEKTIGGRGEQLTFFDDLGDGLEITLTNLQYIFNVWMDEIKPQIAVEEDEWEKLNQDGVYPSDFFLADVYGNAESGNTEIAGMKVVFKNGEYRLGENIGAKSIIPYEFKDHGGSHGNFWRKYRRPPRSEKQSSEKTTPYNEILERKDLLVPRDIMERKGAFFTPHIWVEKAHEAIAQVLGKDWQKEYYVWDCACGTGNLLAGLTNRKNLFASTIDESDIRIIHANLKGVIFRENAFQFDFLNDSFEKLPEKLRKIIESPEERKKLIVLINPPYAETASRDMTVGSVYKQGNQKSMVDDKYSDVLKNAANREIFVQFFTRIYFELDGCILAEFSKLKILQSPNFKSVRDFFQAKLLSCFLAPADTFDNVKGTFPIGFKIWDLNAKEKFENIDADVFDNNGKFIGKKNIVNYDSRKLIISFIKSTRNRLNEIKIGFMRHTANDFQNNNIIHIMNNKTKMKATRGTHVTTKNLAECCIYLAVRWAIEADWLNDRDQFLYPNTDDFDSEFVDDCLIYTVFSGQNRISAEYGDNHWIPFSEDQCGSEEQFKFDTLYEYLSGRNIPEVLTDEAKAVYDKALEIFRYYHRRKNWSVDGRTAYNHNAGFYDIRAFFQGRNEEGKMIAKSPDDKYRCLMEDLRKNIKTLRDENIAPKVYEYGFLLK